LDGHKNYLCHSGDDESKMVGDYNEGDTISEYGDKPCSSLIVKINAENSTHPEKKHPGSVGVNTMKYD